MADPVRSADALVSHIVNTPGLLDAVKNDPLPTLKEAAKEVIQQLPPPAYVSDKWTYRIVVISLGSVCLIAIGGAIFLSAGTKTIPDVLTALGAAAIGALAGLLAPSPAAK